ncbi:MAG: UvrD-helicase domain-containing protein [Clostridiales Family XIII bacterium]|jgi:DNA helicase-2/ATP-dependent DNA helicase PcrA|nr:UvrD-helicase domain-containing protein [Clostridiales Family XIII bacterium]
MDYLSKLNPQQREAAQHKDGPLLILAGAGSGKTSTMTRRIAWLVREEGISPYSIFAVTFTNKAAKEMRERVEELLGSEIRMWILTFHSACLRILRRHAEALGYDGGFVVYDPTDQKVVMRSLLKAMNLDDKKFTPVYVLSIISDCKEKDMTPSAFAAENESSPVGKVVGELYASYEKTLKKNGAMDFDDLICNTVRLFEGDGIILAQYQGRFRYIMVDEYQDTNYMQYRFIRLLAQNHGNICVVGDDDQCIYQWRGADIRNILEFEKDFKGTKVIKLEQNYRSSGNILDGAHSVISNNVGRKQKKLWTSKSRGEKITYYAAEDEKEEARYVAGEIKKLHGVESEDGSGVKAYSDFAVLYRTNAQSRNFEEAFSVFDIPYRVLGGLRYYDRKEVKDIIAYMRLVQNQADDLSFLRVINEPKRGMGAKTIERLETLAAERGVSMFLLLSDEEILNSLSAKAKASVKSMITAVLELSDERENLSVSDVYDALLLRTGYMRALEDQDSVEAESRIENLLEFKSVISQYEKDEPMISLSEFMERIALLADIDNHDAEEDAVTLMTLHSAKGLEFPVVFMPGMEDGLFPGWRAADTPGGMEEERRLCYVGMTRAMKKLYMIRARQRTLYGKTGFPAESPFMREIGEDCLDKSSTVYEKKKVFRAFPVANDGFASEEVFRPFARRYIEENDQENDQKDQAEESCFAIGDRVKHVKFGDGMVLETDEKTVTVMFGGAGRKKLAIGVAPLKKIQ